MVKSTVKTIVKTAIFTATVSAISILAPMAHKAFLRQYVGKKVVMMTNVNPETSQQYGGGTGFHVTAPSGKVYIVTNRHVCQVSKNGIMYAAVRGNSSYQKVKIIEKSNFSDLCLVEPLPGIDGLKVAQEPSVGQHVAILGHPNLQPRTLTEGEVVGYDTQSMAIGVIGRDGFTAQDCNNKDTKVVEVPDFLEEIKKRFKDIYGSDMFDVLSPHVTPTAKKTSIKICVARNLTLVTTAMAYHGSSGSPLVDFYGRIVGVVNSIAGDRVWARTMTVSDLQRFLSKR